MCPKPMLFSLTCAFIVVNFIFVNAQTIDSGLLVGVHTATGTGEMNAVLAPETGSVVFNESNDILYFFNGNNWVSNTNAHTPYFTGNEVIEVNQSTLETVIINGVNFSSSTSLVIPGFVGSYAYTVLSPTQIEFTSIQPTAIGIYDIVISDNGNINTSWPGNGVGKLQVIASNGSSAKNAGKTCKAIYDDGYSTGNGQYWINPDGGDHSNAFEVTCDMVGGGWTAVPYQYDMPLEHQFYSTDDSRRWLNRNFILGLTDQQINDIRNASTEAKQDYVGDCIGVISYGQPVNVYNNSFGFRLHTGFQTNYGVANYNINITVTQDGCYSNDVTTTETTIFKISDLRLPVININSRDHGGYNEKFGSNLTNNPAWFK